jgi:hypothetical protein
MYAFHVVVPILWWFIVELLGVRLQFKLNSVPLGELDVPLDAANDDTPIPPGVPGTVTPITTTPDVRIAEAKMKLARGCEDMTNSGVAGRIAAWLGLSPLQARTLIAVQRFPPYVVDALLCCLDCRHHASRTVAEIRCFGLRLI